MWHESASAEALLDLDRGVVACLLPMASWPITQICEGNQTQRLVMGRQSLRG